MAKLLKPEGFMSGPVMTAEKEINKPPQKVI